MIELLMRLNAPVVTTRGLQTLSAKDRLISGDIDDAIRFNYILKSVASLTRKMKIPNTYQ